MHICVGVILNKIIYKIETYVSYVLRNIVLCILI